MVNRQKKNQLSLWLFIISIFLNIVLVSFFTYHVYRNGGIPYLQGYVHHLFTNDEGYSGQPEAVIRQRPHLYQLFSSLYENMQAASGDIFFVGDSHIEYCPWAELFQKPNVKNRGIAGDTVDGILERIEAITRAQPAKIFIMAGINDITRGIAVSTIADHYRQLIDTIQQQTPATDIYILSVLPFAETSPNQPKNSKVFSLNRYLHLLADRGKVHFVDLFAVMSDHSNNLDARYSYDGLHLNRAGYALIQQSLQAYL